MKNKLNRSHVKVWILACFCMIFHSFFDVLRDGYLWSPEIRKLIIVDWHVIKVMAMIFLVFSALLIWQYMRNYWGFFIGILIVRWGAFEFFWNLLDKSYSYSQEFMGISFGVAGSLMIAGILLPLVSYFYYIKIINRCSEDNKV